MNEESEMEPAAKKRRIDDNVTISKANDEVDFTEDVTDTKDQGISLQHSKYDDLVTPEEVERLKEFRVLDEVKSNDENSDENEDSDDESEGIPEDEIEKMLEENLPEQMKGVPKPKEKPYVTCHKIILEEKGVNQFEILPLEWLCVRHCSGIPIYLHRPSRVATLSRPYALGKGNTKRHEIPISAIPCLSYRKALEEEAKQNEIDKIIEEQIRTGSWKDNIDNSKDPCTSKNYTELNNEINQISMINKNVRDNNVTKDEGSNNASIEENVDDVLLKPNNDCDKIKCADNNEISSGCNTFLNVKELNNELLSHNVVDSNIIKEEYKVNGGLHYDGIENASSPLETSKNEVISNVKDDISIEIGSNNYSYDISKEILNKCPYDHKISQKQNHISKSQLIEIKYEQNTDQNDRRSEKIQTETEYSEIESQLGTKVTQNNAIESQINTLDQQNNDVKYIDVISENTHSLLNKQNISSTNLNTSNENSSTSIKNQTKSNEPSTTCTNQCTSNDNLMTTSNNTNTSSDVQSTSHENTNTTCQNTSSTGEIKNTACENTNSTNENTKTTNGNTRTTNENTKTTNENAKTTNENTNKTNENPNTTNENSNTTNETTVPITSDPRLLARPIVLPGGIAMPPPRVENISTSWKTQHLTAEQVNDYCKKLFKFKTVKVMHFVRWPERRKYARARKALQAAPLPRGTTLITLPNTTQSRGRRDWVMNTQGCSYLSVFHEYVQRALQHQPVYEFQQLENASTPYQATVYIGGMQYGVGRGASKRAAKSAAARASMQVLVPGLGDWDPARADLAFFEGVGVEDPRVSSLCAAACEPSPHAVLRTCLLRNLGAASLNMKMKKLEHQKIELTMTVGKHSATVVCKNKKTAKQRAAQAILQALHPHIKSWGSLLRLYGSRSGEGGGAARRKEARAVTSLQEHAQHNQPNLAVLTKLREEMRRLSQRDTQLAPLRTMMLDHLPTASSSELNNVDL